MACSYSYCFHYYSEQTKARPILRKDQKSSKAKKNARSKESGKQQVSRVEKLRSRNGNLRKPESGEAKSLRPERQQANVSHKNLGTCAAGLRYVRPLLRRFGTRLGSAINRRSASIE